MIDILAYLPFKRKQTPSGWISFNAVCCAHNGEKTDKRQRGGIKFADDGWSYHCFNCGYKSSFVPGRQLSYKTKKLLSWLGVPDQEIEKINLESLKFKSINGLITDRTRLLNELGDVSFNEFNDLPPHAELITPDHTTHWQYLRSRLVPEDFPTLSVIHNDGVHWTRPHVIVPFTYDGTMVGWTVRFLDNKSPKYINHTQPGYVFGTDLQRSEWQHIIVVEGIFDALSIDGLAVMHNTISDKQARLIRNLGKNITVVPDQDYAGMDLVDRAIELGWAVSIPDWEDDVKDVNDAVVKYGRLTTLLTIMQARETSKIKIQLRKRNLVKRL